MIWACSLDHLRYPGVFKHKNGFGAQGHVRKSPNHENEGFEGAPIMKSNS